MNIDLNDDRMYEEWWDGDADDVNTFIHQHHSHHHAHCPQAAEEVNDCDNDEQESITIGESNNSSSRID